MTERVELNEISVKKICNPLVTQLVQNKMESAIVKKDSDSDDTYKRLSSEYMSKYEDLDKTYFHNMLTYGPLRPTLCKYLYNEYENTNFLDLIRNPSNLVIILSSANKVIQSDFNEFLHKNILNSNETDSHFQNNECPGKLTTNDNYTDIFNNLKTVHFMSVLHETQVSDKEFDKTVDSEFRKLYRFIMKRQMHQFNGTFTQSSLGSDTQFKPVENIYFFTDSNGILDDSYINYKSKANKSLMTKLTNRIFTLLTNETKLYKSSSMLSTKLSFDVDSIVIDHPIFKYPIEQIQHQIKSTNPDIFKVVHFFMNELRKEEFDSTYKTKKKKEMISIESYKYLTIDLSYNILLDKDPYRFDRIKVDGVTKYEINGMIGYFVNRFKSYTFKLTENANGEKKSKLIEMKIQKRSGIHYASWNNDNKNETNGANGQSKGIVSLYTKPFEDSEFIINQMNTSLPEHKRIKIIPELLIDSKIIRRYLFDGSDSKSDFDMKDKMLIPRELLSILDDEKRLKDFYIFVQDNYPHYIKKESDFLLKQSAKNIINMILKQEIQYILL